MAPGPMPNARAAGKPRSAEMKSAPVARRASDSVQSFRLARRQQHHHLAAFEARLRFHLRHRRRVFLDALEQLVAELLVRHFAAAEAQGDLDLVAFLEEALH